MQKTSNYQLNQWEATDKLSRADFNSDNAAIDAALAAKAEKSAVSAVETALANYKSSNDAAVAGKADTSAVSVLQTLMETKGNCKISMGSYIGDANYGESTPNTLTFGFVPHVVFLASMRRKDQITLVYGMKYCGSCSLTWTDNTLSWYSSTDAITQFNVYGDEYRYVVIG